MLPARTVNGATGVFCGPREHPNIFQGTGHHWLIFQENKGINLILGDRKVAIWKNSSFSMHWPYTFVVVCRQSQCFDALLIFKRMLMSENRLKQDVLILQFKHRICCTFCVRRYQQFCTLMVNGNAYNQNSLIAVTHWVEDWFDQVGSLVLFNRACPKSTTGFSHAPLETAFSLHHENTAWPPRLLQLPVIIASNFTCSKVILSGDFYCGNASDPPAQVKPSWDTKI